jgi:hypothetical protein
MTPDTEPKPNRICLAVRQAAQHVTQSYDQFLAHAGLRTTQFHSREADGPMTSTPLPPSRDGPSRRLGATFFLWSATAVSIDAGIRPSQQSAASDQAGDKRLRRTDRMVKAQAR